MKIHTPGVFVTLNVCKYKDVCTCKVTLLDNFRGLLRVPIFLNIESRAIVLIPLRPVYAI